MIARREVLQRLSSEAFDIVIVGAGITGAAIASRAARSGLTTLLIEKNDFGSGTSSASSKMLHGGLRYLEQGHISLVKEALRERGRLVRRLGTRRARVVPFLLPIRGSAMDGFKLRFGTWMYQRLSGKLALGPRRVLSADEVRKRVPSLRTDRLRGGVLYYEGVVDDVLLVLDLVRTTIRHGGVALNHARVTRLIQEEGKVIGVEFRDAIGGTVGRVRARGVVNAAGVWSGQWAGASKTPALRPSKGVHLVFPHDRFPVNDAVVLEAPDHRWVFALPYGRLTIVGTTDTDYSGDLDAVVPEKKDVSYLLDTIHREFPNLKVGVMDIVDAYAGLRPLLAGVGQTPGELSREDVVQSDPSGLVTTVGGKLTTHAAMAERTLKLFSEVTGIRAPRIPVENDHPDQEDRPWPGTDWVHPPLTPSSGLASWDHIVESEAGDLLAATLEDVVDRRLHYLERLDPHFVSMLTELSKVVGRTLSWSETDREEMLRTYQTHLAELHRAIYDLQGDGRKGS
jgi:glycerol-3-phosphate dehydrogenase